MCLLLAAPRQGIAFSAVGSFPSSKVLQRLIYLASRIKSIKGGR